MHYVIMDSNATPVGILQTETLRKMLAYTSNQLRAAEKREGFLPPTEKEALKEINKIQALHTELI